MSETRWFLHFEGTSQGPLTYQDLRQRADLGEFDESDLVYREGSPNWVRAGECEELKNLFIEQPTQPEPVNEFEVQWIVLSRDLESPGSQFRQQGPYSTAQVVSLLREGMIRETDHVWQKGLEQWVPISSCPDLMQPLEAASESTSSGYIVPEADEKTAEFVIMDATPALSLEPANQEQAVSSPQADTESISDPPKDESESKKQSPDGEPIPLEFFEQSAVAAAFESGHAETPVEALPQTPEPKPVEPDRSSVESVEAISSTNASLDAGHPLVVEEEAPHVPESEVKRQPAPKSKPARDAQSGNWWKPVAASVVLLVLCGGSFFAVKSPWFQKYRNQKDQFTLVPLEEPVHRAAKKVIPTPAPIVVATPTPTPAPVPEVKAPEPVVAAIEKPVAKPEKEMWAMRMQARKDLPLDVTITGVSGQILKYPALNLQITMKQVPDVLLELTPVDLGLPDGNYIVQAFQDGKRIVNEKKSWNADGPEFAEKLARHRKQIAFDQQQEKKRLLKSLDDLQAFLVRNRVALTSSQASMRKKMLHSLKYLQTVEYRLLKKNRNQLVYISGWKSWAEALDAASEALTGPRSPAHVVSWEELRKKVANLRSEISQTSLTSN